MDWPKAWGRLPAQAKHKVTMHIFRRHYVDVADFCRRQDPIASLCTVAPDFRLADIEDPPDPPLRPQLAMLGFGVEVPAMTENHFKWGALVGHIIHPAKVAIIEAMEWLAVPLSARELDRIFDEQFGVSHISYHMRTLAEVGAVEKVRQRAVRGATESFYALSAKGPASSDRRGRSWPPEKA
jgi:hypothetical protein